MEGDQRHQRSQRHSSGKTGHFEEDHEITKVMTPPPFALTASPVSPPNDSGASDESEEFEENSFLKEQESASAPPDESPNGLPKELRLQMEDSLGHDFSTVQIVRDSQEALASGAEAFAAGDTLHFAPGFYNPSSADGRALIGHELAHIVQQREGRVQASREVNGMPLNDDHGLESEAASLGAKAAENNIAGKSKEAERKMDGLQKAGNVSLRVGKKVMQRNIFSNAWDWGKKAVSGVADFAGKAIGGVAKVANKALGAVGNFVGNAAKTVAGAAWGGINNLADLLGFDLPDNTTEALVAIGSALGSALFFPFKALIPKAVSGTLDMISKVWDFFDKIAEKGKEVIEAIRSWMQTRIDAVEAKAKEKLEEQGVPESHWDGVMSYLQPMLESMAANWWDAIVEGLWELIWPIPGVWADIQGIGEQILVAGGHLWHLRFSKFADSILQIWSKLTAIVARLMGWLTIILVVGTAIVGSLAGPGGTLAGAVAGFEAAGAIGLGVLLSTAACELAIVVKSRVSLHSLEDAETDETKALENELYYENIASGILTLSLLLVMVLIAAAAVKFAKAIVGKVKGIFKRPPLKTRGKKRYRPQNLKESRAKKTGKTGTEEAETVAESPGKSSKTKEGPKVSEFEQNLPSKIKNSARFRGMKEPKRSALLRDLEADPNLLAAMEAEPKLIDVWNHVTHLVGQRGNLEFLKAFEHVLGNDKFQTHIFEGHYKVQWGVPKASGMHSEYGFRSGKVRIKPGATRRYSSKNPEVYEAKTERRSGDTGEWMDKSGNGGTSSYFPRSWSKMRTLEEITYVYKEILADKAGSFIAGNEYFGISIDGSIEIHMYIEPSNNIISAFPKVE